MLTNKKTFNNLTTSNIENKPGCAEINVFIFLGTMNDHE
jgi:hypothetical protein